MFKMLKLQSVWRFRVEIIPAKQCQLFPDISDFDISD